MTKAKGATQATARAARGTAASCRPCASSQGPTRACTTASTATNNAINAKRPNHGSLAPRRASSARAATPLPIPANTRNMARVRANASSPKAPFHAAISTRRKPRPTRPACSHGAACPAASNAGEQVAPPGQEADQRLRLASDLASLRSGRSRRGCKRCLSPAKRQVLRSGPWQILAQVSGATSRVSRQ